MLDWSLAFHTGVLVPDLDDAMRDLAAQSDVAWCEPQEMDNVVWTPERGVHTLHMRYTYSRSSADTAWHLELIEGDAGSIWDGRARPGAHHIGLWSPDVGAQTAALVEAGWTVAIAARPPEDGYGVFSYLVPPSGPIVELVSDVVRPFMQRWFDTGSFG